LRICENDGFDTEAMAEIKRGWVERLVGDCDPEVELIAGLSAAEALEEIPRDMNRESRIPA
jgi:hypothetical protein